MLIVQCFCFWPISGSQEVLVHSTSILLLSTSLFTTQHYFELYTSSLICIYFMILVSFRSCNIFSGTNGLSSHFRWPEERRTILIVRRIILCRFGSLSSNRFGALQLGQVCLLCDRGLSVKTGYDEYNETLDGIQLCFGSFCFEGWKGEVWTNSIIWNKK